MAFFNTPAQALTMGVLTPSLMGDIYNAGKLKGQLAIQAQNNDTSRVGIEQQQANTDQSYKSNLMDIAKQDLGIRLSDQDMKKQAFEWQKAGVQRQFQIQQGMTEAAQQGGYGGVIDYLKVVDPERAIKFHAAKLGLDQSIMNNDVMKAQQPNKINQALFDSYGMLSKISAGIMQLPPDQQNNAYQAALPMIKTVLPDADSSLTPRMKGAAQLMIAQGTPANQLFFSNQQMMQNMGDLGKTDMAIGHLTNQGYTPQTSPMLADLQNQRQAYLDKNKQINLDMANAGIKYDQQQGGGTPASIVKSTSRLDDRLQKASEANGYTPLVRNYFIAKPNLDIIHKDPNAPDAKYAAQKLALQYSDLGTKNPDFKSAFLATGGAALWKKVESLGSNLQVELSPDERKGLASFYDNYMNRATQQQLALEGEFKKSAISYGQAINQQDIHYPSEQYFAAAGAKDAQNNTSRMMQLQAQQYGLDKFPPQIQAAALDAINNADGKGRRDPKVVLQMAHQAMQQQNQQTTPAGPAVQTGPVPVAGATQPDDTAQQGAAPDGQ